jgi:maltose O-acetyltransferase
MSPAPTLAADLRRLLRGLTGGRASARRAVDLTLGMARGRLVFGRAQRAGHVYVGGPLTVDARGQLVLGADVFFFGGMIATEIVCHPGAVLSIGAGAELNYGVSIESRQRVEIGPRCKIGSLVRIADGARGRVAPVLVGADVWIAHGAILEPGAVLGDGSVVSAGSVVTTSIPPGSLAIGNPARAVRLDAVAGAAGR